LKLLSPLGFLLDFELMGSKPAEFTDAQHAEYNDSEAPKRECLPEPMKLIPVIFVLGIISVLYAIFVFCHCVPMLQIDVREEHRDDSLRKQGIVQLSVFHFITFMLLICYYLSIVTHPGEIPEEDSDWQYLPPDGMPPPTQSGATAPKAREAKSTGERRHCKWCGKYKPDRCHHCRVCQTCILKMDHHCPWIYNCVGHRNYKFFFLLLFYTVLDLHLIVWTMVPSVNSSLMDDTTFGTMFFLLFGETLACFLAFFLTSFFIFHVWLTSNAMTTIEFCEKSLPKKAGESAASGSVYDLGRVKNWKNALGSNLFLALVPTPPKLEDGLRFEMDEARARAEAESHSARKEQRREQRPRRFKRRAQQQSEALSGGGAYYGSMDAGAAGGAGYHGLVPRTNESLDGKV